MGWAVDHGRIGCPVGAGVGVLVGMVNGIAGRRFGWITSPHFGGVTGRSELGMIIPSCLKSISFRVLIP